MNPKTLVHRGAALVLILSFGVATAYAAPRATTLDLGLDGSYLTLAQAEASAAGTGRLSVASGVSASGGGGLRMESIHKYLGYGTLVAGLTTALTAGDNGFHKGSGVVTATAALSTVVTGLLAHNDRFDLSDGLFSVENIHIALGTVGAAVLATGVALAAGGEEGVHSGLAVGGGVCMALAVIDIQF